MSEQRWGHGRVVVGGALLLAAVLFSVPAIAHHGWGGYAAENARDYRDGRIIGGHGRAHATMRVKVDNQVWDVVLAPPARAQTAGLKDGRFLSAKRSPSTAIATRCEEVRDEDFPPTWNGKVFNVYPTAARPRHRDRGRRRFAVWLEVSRSAT